MKDLVRLRNSIALPSPLSILRVQLLGALGLGFFFAAPLAVEAATTPPDFEDALVTGVIAPTGLAFTPDGRLLITTQQGQVRIYQNGALLQNPAINLSSKICANSERGVLGIAVDPEFNTNRFVYLYYTFNKTGTCNSTAVNRVARFILSDNNTIETASEVVLIDNIHSPAGNHNAGDLHFGKDGFLYVSVGDGGCDYAGDSGCAGANDATRDRHVLLGKILRITRDGGIPPTNPHRGTDSGRCNVAGSTTPGNWCQETFASGLRNPFRIAFDPNATITRFFINDVGQGVWEEIDEGHAGADYGWNVREGHCPNNSTTGCSTEPTVTVNNQVFTNPVFDYPHTGNCAAAGVRGNSITGGAFVPNGVWTAEYDNSYLFGEYVCGKIFKLTPRGGGGFAASEFITGLGGSSAVTLLFGPYENTQALYYTTYQAGGQVRRIRYTGAANRAPVAQLVANPASGFAPLDVRFDASASTDPDGDALTYSWNFGDNTTGTGSIIAHRYTRPGAYDAIVTVSDNRGGTSTATTRVDVGNTAPQPTILAPTATQLFRVGEVITLRGSATDEQDGALAAERLTWEVILHHNNDHTHPFLPPTAGNNIQFTAPAPEDLNATTGSFLEIRLTATDSNNLSRTVVQNFQPRKVNLTFATQPAGLQLTVNNATFNAPRTIVSWDGYRLNVSAPNQTAGTTAYAFQSWSDGGATVHEIVTPASETTYTANFIVQTAPPPSPEVELRVWTLQNRSYAFVKLNFPDDSYEVSDWGQVVRDGATITARATIRRTAVRLSVPLATAHIYDLGALPNGTYTFNFGADGVPGRSATLTVNSDPAPANAIDEARTFVREHYRDLLSREPDAPGLDHWTGEITECGEAARRRPGESEAQCVDRKRANTSGAFFISLEFQATGYYVYRLYQGALSRQPRYAEFLPDTRAVAAGIVVDNRLVPETIDLRKREFARLFVQRAEFRAIYDALTDDAYLDLLFQNTGSTPTSEEHAALRTELASDTGTREERRASVLAKIVDGIRTQQTATGSVEQIFTTGYGKQFYDREYNRAFVLMQYFGYLRRDPDAEGYAFWLDKLNRFGNFLDAEMVRAFIVSSEYRSRFGQP